MFIFDSSHHIVYKLQIICIIFNLLSLSSDSYVPPPMGAVGDILYNRALTPLRAQRQQSILIIHQNVWRENHDRIIC